MIHNISIIGAGKLGAALAFKLENKNLLNCILIRSLDKRKYLADFFPTNKIIPAINNLNLRETDAIILAIPDSAIEEVANDIANEFNEKLAGKYVIHCSGKERLDILKSCAKKGALIASAHPYQTFFRYTENVFNDVPWLIEAENYDEIADFIKLLNGKPFYLSADELEKKPLYHCSAVVVSNLLASTISLSKQMLKEFKSIDSNIINKIVDTTIQNSFNDSAEVDLPMTGPLIRADLNTIAGHIEQLKSNMNLMKSYKALCISALEMLQYLHKINDEDFNRMKSFLESVYN